jgi:sugar phosphate isomerase/epimerase
MSWLRAFSTLGCPGLPLTEVAALARTTGWLGLELRAAADEPVHVGLTPAERAEASTILNEGGARPLAIASYVKVASGAVDDATCITDALAHAKLTQDLGCAYVRVFPRAEEPGPQADNRAARRLKAVAAELPDGVTILLETHDSHPRGADVARVLANVDHPGVRALWDVLHPWRHGEPITETAATLAPWLAHVQIKDARSATDLLPVFLGTGAVPLAEALDALRDMGYAGALSLEWEKKWHPDAAPLADALTRGTDWLDAALADISRRRPRPS